MVNIPHSAIPENPGGTNPNPIIDTVRQARNAICGLYSRHPQAATFPQVPGTAPHQWAVAVWDTICRDDPAERPPDPKRQFGGGQCQCINYLITFRLRFRDGTVGGLSTITRTGKISLGGRIQPGIGTLAFELFSFSCTNNPPTPVTSIIGQHFDTNPATLEIVSVVRADGLPDNCGDPPVEYPPEFKDPLPTPIPIVPVVPTEPNRPGTNWNIVVPLGYFDVDGSINVDVGGVNLNFNAGGIDFNFDNNFGNGEPGSGSGESPDLSGLEAAINAAKDAAEQAKDAADGAKDAAEGARKGTDDRNNNDGDDPQNDPNKQNKEERDEDDPKEEAGIERLLAVIVSLIEKPRNIREQSGNGAPNVYYAGWFQFSTKGIPHPRHYIHFENNYFVAPIGADGFSYTVYEGIRARHTVITAKEPPPPTPDP